MINSGTKLVKIINANTKANPDAFPAAAACPFNIPLYTVKRAVQNIPVLIIGHNADAIITPRDLFFLLKSL